MQIEFKKTIAETYMSKPNTICNGAILAPFSVSPTKKVFFSKGNLQYRRVGSHLTAEGTTIKGTWRFAEHQFDCVSGENSGFPDDPESEKYNPKAITGNVYYESNGVLTKCDNKNSVNPDYLGWFDCFSWASSGYNNGYSVHSPGDYSTNMSDYLPRPKTGGLCLSDWGIYNAITNGGNTPNCWRTMTYEESKYLFFDRENAETLFSFGKIIYDTPTPDNATHTNGIIILPDTWSSVPEGCEFNHFTTSSQSAYTYEFSEESHIYELNSYTEEQWEKMESAGAVFIPVAGICTNSSTYVEEGLIVQIYDNADSVCRSCFYLSSANTINSVSTVPYLQVQPNSFYNTLRKPSWCLPVRLVTDIPTEFQPDWNQEDSTKSDYIKNKPILGGVQFKIEDDSLKTSLDGGSTWKTVQLTE